MSRQMEIQPLRDKVRDTLIAAGFHEYEFPTLVPGFEVKAITPPAGWSFVRVEHIDVPYTDCRPNLAQYNATLEKAGIEMTWDYDVIDDRYLALEIRHRFVPFELGGMIWHFK